jgi:hypothetical protein
VISLDQLLGLGLSADAVRLRARSGRLHRIHSGVYALVPAALLTGRGRWMAAVLACGPGAVLSHHSAADLLGLRASAHTRIDVTVRSGSHRSRPGIAVHRSRTMTNADVTTVDAIPCTTVARTLLDLAGVLTPRRLERALDQAAALEVLDLPALERQRARHPTTVAASRLATALALRRPGRTTTWSELEEAFLALTRAAGLPDPAVNRFIDPGDGEPPIRADFQWPERRLAVETDGWRTHRTRASFERDRRNDLRLAAAAWQVVRTTWRAIDTEPATLAARIAAVYEAG